MKVNRLKNKLNIIGHNVKKYRNLKNLTKEDICTKMSLLGISLYRSNIYKIEHFERIIKNFEAYAFCKILGILLDMLFKKQKKNLTSIVVKFFYIIFFYLSCNLFIFSLIYEFNISHSPVVLFFNFNSFAFIFVILTLFSACSILSSLNPFSSPIISYALQD